MVANLTITSQLLCNYILFLCCGTSVKMKFVRLAGYSSVVVILSLLCNEMSHAESYKKHLGEECQTHVECDTSVCHPLRKICECNVLTDYDLGKKVEQMYEHGSCFSRIYQMCTMPGAADRDGLLPFTCINGAYCAYNAKGRGSRQLFGMCACKVGLNRSDNGRRCALKPIIQNKSDKNGNSDNGKSWKGTWTNNAGNISRQSNHTMSILLVLSYLFGIRL